MSLLKDKYNFRPSTVDDSQAVLDILDSLDDKDKSFLAYNAKKSLIRKNIKKGKHVYIAEQDGSIVGFARESGRPENGAMLEELVVHPEHRGKGIGREFINYIQTQFPYIEMKTKSDNSAMASLADKSGFSISNKSPAGTVINWCAEKKASLRDRHIEKTAKLKEHVQLYPHQEGAVQKIVDNDENDRNTILAHSVGAGKTLTTIAGFEKLREQGKANRALVVVPASLRENYAIKGVKEFTDSSYNMVGNKQENRSPKMHYQEVDPSKDYNIVSYEMFRKDPRHYIEGSDADTVIFDELHRSKNITKTYDSIRDSRNMYRTFIGGTGSIVSNKLTDVVPLIDAATAGENAMTKRENIRRIEQKFFIRDNSKRFKDVKEERRPIIALKNKGLLKRELGKYIDFVDFDDIAESANMPKKEVHEIEVPITPEQATAYRKLLHSDKALDKLIRQRRYEYMRDDELSRMYNKLMEARKIMNDVGTYQPKMSVHDTVEATPKTRRLLENVEEHLDEDPKNKALLTSFLVRGGTESLEAGLQNRGIKYGKFIGKGNDGVTEESRQKAVEDFNAGKIRALILSGAGGEGLSLGDTTEIDMLDSHFNPEKIKQMEARGIRSGGLSYKEPEDRKVVSNRYIATMPEHKFLFFHWKDKLKTPDEIIYEIAEKKEKQNKLLHDVLKEDRDKRKVASLRERYIEKNS